MNFESASPAQLTAIAAELESQYQQLAAQHLNLDITRGKPGTTQVALSDALDGILQGHYHDDSGIDVRNYGGLEGLPALRALFAEMVDCTPDQVLIGGNSSLTLMYQVMELALNHGLNGPAWRDQGEVRFLCPVPGYDRHFGICEYLGIGMVNVDMLDSGPDMNQVEALVKADPGIKGIWCVPRFSNPSGAVYSEATVKRLAALNTIAGEGFLIFWDNAYAVHTLDDTARQLPSLNAACAAAGTANSTVMFGSTSKITHAGAGVAFLASSAENLQRIKHHTSVFSIGPDKVNQLRHLRLLPDMTSLHQHMAQHAAIIGPRFQLTQEILETELGDTGLGQWSQPEGGYFVSFDSRPGLAGTIVQLAGDVGVKLTPAGATFPYGNDPKDSNIRIAPTFPSMDDLKLALLAFTTCVKLASVRQLLNT